jgi:orotate phosphoribosyltransferase
LVEDLISTGGSSLLGVKALKEAGLKVKGLVAIFSYGFDTAKEGFDKADCPFYTLTDYDHLVAEALTQEYIREEELDQLKKWRELPDSWEPEL